MKTSITGDDGQLRLGEAAEILGVSPETVRRWADDGRLPAERSTGGQRLVRRADVARLLTERRRAGQDRPIVAQSARNRFPGVVTRIEHDRIVGLVEVQAGPHRVVSLMTARPSRSLACASAQRPSAWSRRPTSSWRSPRREGPPLLERTKGTGGSGDQPARPWLAPAVLGALVLMMGAGPGASAQSSAPVDPTPASLVCEPPPSPIVTARAVPDPAMSPTVSVAAASDLRYAMDELVAAYQATHPDQAVRVTYGLSVTSSPRSARAHRSTSTSPPTSPTRSRSNRQAWRRQDSTHRYAQGRLVVWVGGASPIDVDGLGIRAVLDPAAERVAIANPEHAPYGRAAQAAMEAAGVWEAVQPRIGAGRR